MEKRKSIKIKCFLKREREGRRSYIGTKIDRQTYTVRQRGCGTYRQAVKLTDRL